jgi:uncharacterized membrane protein
MKPSFERWEQAIAQLLWYGTWIAVLAVGVGMAMGLSSPDGLTVAKAGIALFILLPIARVGLMLALFIWERDYVYAAISVSVLLVIASGIVAGMYRLAIHF